MFSLPSLCNQLTNLVKQYQQSLFAEYSVAAWRENMFLQYSWIQQCGSTAGCGNEELATRGVVMAEKYIGTHAMRDNPTIPARDVDEYEARSCYVRDGGDT